MANHTIVRARTYKLQGFAAKIIHIEIYSTSSSSWLTTNLHTRPNDTSSKSFAAVKTHGMSELCVGYKRGEVVNCCMEAAQGYLSRSQHFQRSYSSHSLITQAAATPSAQCKCQPFQDFIWCTVPLSLIMVKTMKIWRSCIYGRAYASLKPMIEPLSSDFHMNSQL